MKGRGVRGGAADLGNGGVVRQWLGKWRWLVAWGNWFGWALGAAPVSGGVFGWKGEEVERRKRIMALFDGSGRKWRVPIWLKKKGVVREKVRRGRGYAGVVFFRRREIKEGGLAAIFGVLRHSGVVGRRGEREKRGESSDGGFPAMVILFPAVGRSGRRKKKRERGPAARRREKKEK
ncbi:hypothetical protein HAX54_049777 [Datura stramonium]|uniref:Uncharacterized protein n=1 Tax=Datura stramonium TaxID=4076 RepID=A0ABS8SVE8_DATST|nr:hypothetical protein [Datura stramonium]